MKGNEKPPRGPRPKHVPQRTCIACGQIGGKRALVRVVRTAAGVEVDPTGKKAGRGAYVHATRQCWEQVLKGNRLEQALRTKLSAQDRIRLHDFGQALPKAEDESPIEQAESAATQPGHQSMYQDR